MHMQCIACKAVGKQPDIVETLLLYQELDSHTCSLRGPTGSRVECCTAAFDWEDKYTSDSVFARPITYAC